MLFVLQKYLNWTMHVKNMEINYFTFSFFDISSWQFSEFRLLMKGRWPLLIFVGYARVFKEDVSLHFYFDTSVILSDKSLKNDLNFFSFLVILYAFVFFFFSPLVIHPVTWTLASLQAIFVCQTLYYHVIEHLGIFSSLCYRNLSKCCVTLIVTLV